MGPIFKYNLCVQQKDIDSLGHVNNEVYLRWLIEAATAHSDSLGFHLSRYIEMGQVFVVRRHELEYLLPTYLNEDLIVETWAEKFEGARANRQYKIIRTRDSKVILTGKTLWVYIDMKTGRPMNVPENIQQAYTPSP
jgi:acyl-CoA thioester hydrolase